MGVQFERGDLVFFRYLRDEDERQSGGIVIGLDDGLLTIALPQGVEVWNLRSACFVSAWRVEHAPRSMDEVEVLDFASRRLAELRARPPVLVEPEDDRLFTNEAHSEHRHSGSAHSHAHRGVDA